MIGFVLAAGFGNRLKPLTDHVPKAMVSVCGRPLLSRALQTLTEAGLTDILVNTHYLHEQIIDFRSHSPQSFSLSHEPVIRGTGGAIEAAKAHLSRQDSFCVVNADIISTADIKSAAADFLASGEDFRLLCAPAAGRGTVWGHVDGRYLGTPADTGIEPGLRADFIGTAFYRRSVLSHFEPEDFSVVPVWKRLADTGLRGSIAVLEDLYWKDTGTPAEILAIHRDFLDKRIALPIDEELYFDETRHMVYPRAHEPIRITGSYAWIDRHVLLSDLACLSDVVACEGSIVPGTQTTHAILTRWGTVVVA